MAAELKIFFGVVTKKGKQGHWVRYWDNGNKKDEGFYINSKKRWFMD